MAIRHSEEMFVETRPATPDYVIVGGGTAGCVIARRLCDAAAGNVVLLEAGPDFRAQKDWPPQLAGRDGTPLVASSFNWIYPTETTPGLTHDTYGGKVIGGSGSINGAVFLRAAREDFDNWPNGWDFESACRYYKRSECDRDFADEWHGSHGPVPVERYRKDELLPFQQAFVEAAQTAGFETVDDLNGASRAGVGRIPRNVRKGLRMNMAICYLESVRSRENLTVVGGAQVTRILVKGSRAIGVEYLAGGEVRTLSAREVIVCAGAFESPRLLMLSGLGPSEHLRNQGIAAVLDLPGVGQNLQDHPSVQVSVVPTSGHLPRPRESRRYQTALFFSSSEGVDSLDMQVLPGFTLGSDSVAATGRAADCIKFGCILNIPDSRGEITLASADPVAAPAVRFGFLTNPSDIKRLREAVLLCNDLLLRRGFDGIVAGRLSPSLQVTRSESELKAWIRQNVRAAFHAGGSCRMGADDDDHAVVDARLRVRGIEGLRIADMSVAPNAVRGNPNATAVMIGEHAADLILADGGVSTTGFDVGTPVRQ